MARNDLGPSGVETFVQMDTANRVLSMRRGPVAAPGNDGPIMTATYTYNTLGLLTSIVYGNGASTTYQYDAVRRLTQIAQKDASGGTLLQMDYTYTNDDLPATITESGTLIGSAVVTFTYDNRRRLIHEVRTGTTPYDLAYEYDAGGNRTKKIDALTYAPDVLQTEYTYDTSSPATYGSNNNRLVSYGVSRVSPGQAQTLLSTTWYYYTVAGNVERVVTKPEASATYTATRFGYAFNGRAVTFAAGEVWDDASVCPPVNYQITWGREFRYDGARARYLNREFDPVALMSGNFVSLGDTWTDYDGDDAYGDYEVTPGYPPTVTNRRSYQPGLAQVDPWMSSGSTATDYMMTDHLGTTRLMIGSSGTGVSPVVYTAFGERISGTNHRFGYVGSWGYQSNPIPGTPNPDTAFPFLHVGARYYDPATGRFLQRDPIGIWGGVNVYAYVGNTPTDDVDPEGLQRAVRPIRFPSRGGSLPYEPPGFKRVPAPDTEFPGFPPNQTFGSLATNCVMFVTGGNYVGGPTPPPPPPCSCGKPPYDGHHLHPAPPPRKGDGHTLWCPLRVAAFAILLYVLGWSVCGQKFRLAFAHRG